ncbi:MAG: type IX secretion system membrane protein PorP/SprF [Flavobacteriales bacterium]|nr:type IX secretion system membrane protein PorP/SprF [Flavobacteriales bacterium]
MNRDEHVACGCVMAFMLLASGIQRRTLCSPIRLRLHGLNPALAGAVNDLQVTLVQRTKRNPIGDPFHTLAAGVHGCVKRGKEQGTTSGGRFGAGIQFRSDRTTALNTTEVALALAYHVPVTRNSRRRSGPAGGFAPVRARRPGRAVGQSIRWSAI